ncbi:putative transporter -like protein [Hapsidospora chrysogenum ATCC 11550]|uniref:CefM protein n=2 Tax=Hapsidospora chrysogena TaxID=5044 RepID=B7FAY6_HAPCH|nr:putative transporter -like protein [Hapsidospora chrysogenum ATCC 11550]CAJ77895.1 CefM protein [Hapsidospora chrysogena]
MVKAEEDSAALEAAIDNGRRHIVDFDGPTDPDNAVNWPAARKWLNVFVLAAMTFIAALGSSIAAPGVNQAIVDFDSTSSILSSLIVSVYNVGLAIGPLIVAPLSEMYGRLIPYHVTNVLFVLFTIGCALSPNLPALVIFRMLAGMEASAVMTIGGATVADLFIQEERGRAMAIWTFGPLMGPAVGPAVGGYLAEAKGWRWVFWVVAIGGGFITGMFFLIARETYPPVLLQRKVNRLRQETGNPLLTSALADTSSRRARISRSVRRPLVLLFRSPIVFLFSVFIAVVFSYQFLLFVTIPSVFGEIYDFSLGQIGLSYLGIAAGLLLGNAIFGQASDRILSKKSGGMELKPEFRLPLMIPGAFCIPMCFFIYGWATYYKLHWMMPICATSLLGIGLNLSLMTIQVYLVDTYTLYSASALAAATILRSLFGAFLPLAGPPLYDALGLGWGNSTLGFIAVALIPVPFLFIRYGEAIRTNPRFQPAL